MNNKNIMIIPARKSKTNNVAKEEVVKKIRVAAYARVSTDNEEQESSYEMQVKHYTEYINSKPEWELVKVYADDGISGTNTKKRDAFNEMIEDARAGKIDKILTKSISRFSRNTVDCLKYTRELKELNISVFFEKENIDTLDAKGEVLMTIMAALAQQESESLSANVRLGIQYRNQQGIVQVNANQFLGYDKDENGKLIINTEQAKVVKRIFKEYLEGKSLIQIKKSLEKDGIKNGRGNTLWWDSNIRQILTNEKYIGDALLQKTFTSNLLEKKRKRNEGEMPQYYVEGSHEPIISKEIFLRTQAELERRSSLKHINGNRCYSGKYALSNIVTCGYCDNKYRRLTWQKVRLNKKEIVWRCISRIENRGVDCNSSSIPEDKLQNKILRAINLTLKNDEDIKNKLKEILEECKNYNNAGRLKEIDDKLEILQRQIITDNKASSELGDEIIALRDERQELEKKNIDIKKSQEEIEFLKDFIEKTDSRIKEYDEEIVRKLVENVIIYNDKIVVKFKTGIEINV